MLESGLRGEGPEDEADKELSIDLVRGNEVFEGALDEECCEDMAGGGGKEEVVGVAEAAPLLSASGTDSSRDSWEYSAMAVVGSECGMEGGCEE